MKKALSLLIVLALAFSCAVVFAESETNDISVTLDGKAITFDVPPQIISGRTMVPMRAIFEAFGAKVNWMQESQIIYATYGSNLILMRIDKPVLVVQDLGAGESGQESKYTMDVPPTLIDGRTLVPARAVAEALGAKVDWDNETRTVVITK